MMNVIDERDDNNVDCAIETDGVDDAAAPMMMMHASRAMY